MAVPEGPLTFHMGEYPLAPGTALTRADVVAFPSGRRSARLSSSGPGSRVKVMTATGAFTPSAFRLPSK